MNKNEDRLDHIETKSDFKDELRWIFVTAPDGFEDAAKLVGYSPPYTFAELSRGLKAALKRIFPKDKHHDFITGLGEDIDRCFEEFETGDEVEACRILLEIEKKINRQRL